MASANVDGGSPTPLQSSDLVAGSVTNIDFTDEDWGAATPELLLKEDVDPVRASPGDENRSDWQLVTQSATPRDEEEMLPNGIPISDFATKVVSWRGLPFSDMVRKAQVEWAISEEEQPRLVMAVKLVIATRTNAEFNLLEAV